MKDALYLEMPPARKSFLHRFSKKMVVVAIFAIILAGLHFWFQMGKVDSVYAVMESNSHAVAPVLPGNVVAVFAQEGSHVASGQKLAQIRVNATEEAFGGVQQTQGVNEPDSHEMLIRTQKAMDLEKAMFVRLEEFKREEDSRRVHRENCVNAHVKALLELRTIESRGGENAVGKNAYAAAVKREADARLFMEQAKVEFENASRTRASVEQELVRIRDEVTRARALASRSRNAAEAGRQGGAIATSFDSFLYAPITGVVVSSFAKAGQSFNAGDALFVMATENAEGISCWVHAYFPTEAGQIAKGQPCRVQVRGTGMSFGGIVDSVGQPQALPTVLQSGTSGGQMGIPARIAIKDGDSNQFNSGQTVDCQIGTNSLLGFAGF